MELVLIGPQCIISISPPSFSHHFHLPHNINVSLMIILNIILNLDLHFQNINWAKFPSVLSVLPPNSLILWPHLCLCQLSLSCSLLTWKALIFLHHRCNVSKGAISLLQPSTPQKRPNCSPLLATFGALRPFSGIFWGRLAPIKGPGAAPSKALLFRTDVPQTGNWNV